VIRRLLSQSGGVKIRSFIFAMLMMLAFLVDQAQQLCCARFHAV
jgi:hypothetical protein